MHDGSARTLEEIWTVYSTNDLHGITGYMNKIQLNDLVEFLKSLPYKTPPDETPNTVKYRLIHTKKE